MSATADRAVNAYYESEAALRLVASELRTLNLLDEPALASDAASEPRVDTVDAAAGLMAAFDRALSVLAAGYLVTEDQQCDHLVVRRALEFEVGVILGALTGASPIPSRTGAPLRS